MLVGRNWAGRALAIHPQTRKTRGELVVRVDAGPKVPVGVSWGPDKPTNLTASSYSIRT